MIDLSKPIDPGAMSSGEIKEYARVAIAQSGDPEADPQPLIDALSNAAARDRALADDYWTALANREANENFWGAQ